MIQLRKIIVIACVAFLFQACTENKKDHSEETIQEESTHESTQTIFLIGDSTMANYADNYEPGKDYMKTRYPVTGWGQVFQQFFVKDSLTELKNLINTDSVIVDDRARGGRSTRTFFQEGRWRKVVQDLKENDIVMMQFGHNDAAENKPERYVNIEGLNFPEIG